MKKGFIVFLVLFCFEIIPVSAATNPYSETQTINEETSVPCTRVVWQEVYDRLGIALPGNWGNAINWLKNAETAGYQVGEIPRENSIAVYSGFYGYGHVAYVLDVLDGYMRIIEGGVVGTEKRDRTTSYEIGSGDGITLTGFIYLDEIPKQPSKNANSNSGTNSNNSSSSNTITKKDGNSYLKLLEIEGVPISFQKDTFTYNVTLSYEVENIVIKAEAEKSTSTIQKEESYSLNVGENVISIKCIAEDESTSEYVLYITREEQKKNTTKKVATSEVKKKKNSTWLIILLSLITLAVIVITFILIFRKKKNYNKNMKKNNIKML